MILGKRGNMNRNYFVVILVIIISLAGCKPTGEAYIFPEGTDHTVYNLLLGVSSINGSLGYRFVIPDGASPELISAVASLSETLNFIGEPTVTETELSQLPENETSYLIHITKNPCTCICSISYIINSLSKMN